MLRLIFTEATAGADRSQQQETTDYAMTSSGRQWPPRSHFRRLSSGL